jgi:glycosyltransferase involved in cell wall biosynthesis
MRKLSSNDVEQVSNPPLEMAGNAPALHHPIRVVMLSHGYYPRIGGAERQLAAVAPLLRARGVDTHILTRRLPGTAPFERLDGIPVYRLPVPGPKLVASLTFTLAALALIKRLNPDLIHAHELISPATTAVIAKKLFGKPVVATLHGSGASSDVLRLKRRLLGKARLKVLCREIDAFSVISDVIDRELAAEGVSVQKRVRIPNGVDVGRFFPLAASKRTALRSRLGLPKEAQIVIFVGRLVPEKQVDHLVNIWESVRSTIPKALLLILGSGPEEGVLKQNADDGILFPGEQFDVVPYLQASDLFVLPSQAEGLSLALLEALACGLPAVVSCVGGSPEVIRHMETGWLIHPDDTIALREAIVTLLSDKELQHTLRRKARIHVVNNYSLVKMADRLCDLYLRLIEQDVEQI